MVRKCTTLVKKIYTIFNPLITGSHFSGLAMFVGQQASHSACKTAGH